jgi:hypothetical protein
MEMIVWGGENYRYLNSGGKYYPSTDSWIPTSLGENVPEGRAGHTALWTGSAMIVWGGCSYTSQANCFNIGAQYDPIMDSWISTSTGQDVPSPRAGHTCVWTGREMIVWGGLDMQGTKLNTGGRYDPANDAWRATSGNNMPLGRSGHTAVWTGMEMIVWGGRGYGGYFNTGGRYQPSSDSWFPTSTSDNVPSSRELHSAVWTGTKMIVWGGYYGDLNTGGLYDPLTDSWTSTSVGANVPSGRYGFTAAWTGREMIIWGGSSYYSDGLDTGGRYDVSSDTWTTTSMGNNVPTGRLYHSAIWTGAEMIIWGGSAHDYHLSSGGIYCPGSAHDRPVTPP